MTTKSKDRKPASKAPVTGPNGPVPRDGSPPPLDDFEDWTAGGERVHFWARQSEGQWLMGELVARRERVKDDGKTEGLLVIEYHSSSPNMQLEPGDTKDPDQPLTPEFGHLIGVNETAALANLKRAVASPRKAIVFIRWDEKVKISGGRTFWQMEVKVKLTEGEKSGRKVADDLDNK